jgi:hypothetical protein
MGNLKRCLLVSILLFYLIGMILGLHLRLSLAVRILVSYHHSKRWREADEIGTEQQVLMMEKIVTRLKSRHGYYNPDAYPNPCKLPIAR